MSQLRDFYTRQENDPAFRPEQFEIYDDLESALQQIKMTLFTKKGEVRSITVRPASYADTKSNRDIFVLLIDIPELKTPLSIFYD
jgi:hypothetical protein